MQLSWGEADLSSRGERGWKEPLGLSLCIVRAKAGVLVLRSIWRFNVKLTCLTAGIPIANSLEPAPTKTEHVCSGNSDAIP